MKIKLVKDKFCCTGCYSALQTKKILNNDEYLQLLKAVENYSSFPNTGVKQHQIALELEVTRLNSLIDKLKSEVTKGKRYVYKL